MKPKASPLALVLLALLAAVGCQAVSGPAPSTDDNAESTTVTTVMGETGATTVVIDESSGTKTATGTDSGISEEIPECSPSPANPWEKNPELAEIRGDSEGARIWALIPRHPPPHAKEEVEIVLRMTSSGRPDLIALASDGPLAYPKRGPQKSPTSVWERPGEEWVSTFVFPQAGCWQVMASRGPETGYVAFMVR